MAIINIFFKGVYYRAVKVSSRLEVGMRVLSTFEVFIDIRNLGEEKKVNLETMVSSDFE